MLWASLVCIIDGLCMVCRYRNCDGIEIRAVDFGGLGGIDALHPSLPKLTPMFSKLTKALKDEGYQERKHLFGAPYDFRLARMGWNRCCFRAAHLMWDNQVGGNC